eukprot:2605165-Amphidinium_carterae.1
MDADKKEATKQHEKTMEMFRFSKSIWLEDGRSGRDDQQVASVESMSSLEKVVTNTEQAMKAAR